MLEWYRDTGVAACRIDTVVSRRWKLVRWKLEAGWFFGRAVLHSVWSWSSSGARLSEWVQCSGAVQCSATRAIFVPSVALFFPHHLSPFPASNSNRKAQTGGQPLHTERTLTQHDVAWGERSGGCDRSIFLASF